MKGIYFQYYGISNELIIFTLNELDWSYFFYISRGL